MANYKLKGSLVKLDNHRATGTEATYTWTPATPITEDQYKEIYIVFQGQTTAALQLDMNLSGLSNFAADYIINDSGTVAGTQATSLADIPLMLNTLLDTARVFAIHIHITLNNGTVMVNWQGYAINEGNVIGGAYNTDATIDSINFTTSTSTWIADTTITIYGRK